MISPSAPVLFLTFATDLVANSASATATPFAGGGAEDGDGAGAGCIQRPEADRRGGVQVLQTVHEEAVGAVCRNLIRS